MNEGNASVDGMVTMDHGLRVAVTGGAGFIGHHLALRLQDADAAVLVIDDMSTGKADRLPRSIEIVRADIAETDLHPILARWAPSIVFHLAAQASVPRGEADPEFDLRVNGVGTLRLVAAAKASGVRRIVFTSSGGALYGERETPARETSPLRPASAYGIHKLLAEHYVMRSGVSYAIARPSNVYGPGQDANGEGAVVAAFSEAILAHRPLVIHGDGAQERDFIHVADLVDGLIRMAAGSASSIWNVSAGRSITITELAAMFERIGGSSEDIRHGPARPADVRLSRIDSARLRRLGWSPRIALPDGLRALLYQSHSS